MRTKTAMPIRLGVSAASIFLQTLCLIAFVDCASHLLMNGYLTHAYRVAPFLLYLDEGPLQFHFGVQPEEGMPPPAEAAQNFPEAGPISEGCRVGQRLGVSPIFSPNSCFADRADGELSSPRTRPERAQRNLG